MKNRPAGWNPKKTWCDDMPDFPSYIEYGVISGHHVVVFESGFTGGQDILFDGKDEAEALIKMDEEIEKFKEEDL